MRSFHLSNTFKVQKNKYHHSVVEKQNKTHGNILCFHSTGNNYYYIDNPQSYIQKHWLPYKLG